MTRCAFSLVNVHPKHAMLINKNIYLYIHPSIYFESMAIIHFAIYYMTSYACISVCETSVYGAINTCPTLYFSTSIYYHFPLVQWELRLSPGVLLGPCEISPWNTSYYSLIFIHCKNERAKYITISWGTVLVLVLKETHKTDTYQTGRWANSRIQAYYDIHIATPYCSTVGATFLHIILWHTKVKVT